MSKISYLINRNKSIILANMGWPRGEGLGPWSVLLSRSQV
jgi:hypothetical protein